jgi:methyl-accepting chemotaxis protein
MINYIKSSISAKVELLMQTLLFVLSISCALAFYNITQADMKRGQEEKIKALADGVINGANMLMLNGIISDVDQRKLFTSKMGSSDNIKSLRIIRNKLVQKQYGPGLPEEQPVADDELRSLAEGKIYFEQRDDLLHGIVPYAAGKNFRGTNCLTCHDVPEGYINGASVIDIDISEDNASLQKLGWVSVVAIALVQLLLWIFISIILRKIVSEPVGQMQKAIIEISETGDFTRRIIVSTEDEIGKAARSFNELMGNLQSAFRQLHSGIEQIVSSSQALSTSAQDVADSSTNQSESAASMSATVEQVTVSINHVSDGASDALKLSRNSGALSEQGAEIILRAAEEMRKISHTVNDTSRAIQNLGDQSTRISSIVKVIEEIADQTNLLALNAAIEAARAGEQGRGFAVVADEVRKLAERTSLATQEVTQMINTIQKASDSAVDGMQATVTQVESGVGLAQQAGDAINLIKIESGQVVVTVSDISAALVEQSKASNDIAANIERVAQMTERNSAAAEQTAGAAMHLEQLAGEMRTTLSRFKI